MRFAFYTVISSPHQIPLSREMVKILGKDGYRYVSKLRIMEERKRLGWESEIDEPWYVNEQERGKEASTIVEKADILMCGIRDIPLLERRCRANKKTFYCAERWFKPRLGILRLMLPSYFLMARRFVRLLQEYNNFFYLPMGIHAARDMARLCGLFAGDWRCAFRAPDLKCERRPGGRVCLAKRASAQEENMYCLGKMKLCGYCVEPSKLDVVSDTCKPVAFPRCRVLWVGRLLVWKRVDTIIRAVGALAELKSVDDSCPEITLDIYGTGPEEKRLKRMARRYGGIVNIHPPVSICRVRELMRQHDVYVLSSNGYEGWGAVVNEALEEGMCVIGTHEAGASATLLPESNLFHAGDWKALQHILQTSVPRIGIGPWSARSVAKEILNL